MLPKDARPQISPLLATDEGSNWNPFPFPSPPTRGEGTNPVAGRKIKVMEIFHFYLDLLRFALIGLDSGSFSRFCLDWSRPNPASREAQSNPPSLKLRRDKAWWAEAVSDRGCKRAQFIKRLGAGRQGFRFWTEGRGYSFAV
jgi:hypothetical protein